jgi:cardiolipin synthase
MPPRSVREAFPNLHRSQPTHPAADGFRSLHRDSPGGGPLSLGARRLDGLLARKLHQQTLLGQYLDPIADKLLLSTMFLVLSILHKIPWKFTVLVFSRDISILAASAVLFAIAGLRNFRPSIFGKANTFSQIAAVFFVLLLEIRPQRWVWIARTVFLRATFIFTIISALHYVILVQQRLREHTHLLPPARDTAL